MAKNVYYSVCPFGTGDIKTGSPTISISNGVATLSVAQTGNIGQGCRITYGGSSVCYISSVIDSTHFDVVTATGNAPSNCSNQTVNSIAHEFASLSAAEAGATDSSHLNSSNLPTLDVILNFPCYYNHNGSSLDTSQYTASGTTTDATHYINVYTPTGGNQSINNQRPANGVWDGNKYALGPSLINSSPAYIFDHHVRLTGLQIKNSNSFGSHGLVRCRNQNSSARIIIDSCILNGEGHSYAEGVMVLNSTSGAVVTIQNTLIYNITNAVYAGVGVATTDGTPDVRIYNSVVSGCYVGIQRSVGTVTVCNTAVFNNGTDFSGTIDTAYTASDDNPSGTGNVDISPSANEATDWANAFTDYANGDFSLKSGSCLINAGTDLSASMSALDIIGTARPQGSSWDIGAFEYISTGGGTTINLTDNGSGADSIGQISVMASLADAGAGADMFGGASAAASVSDAGTGSDGISLGISIALTDSGLGADAVSQLLAALLRSDSGSGTDAVGGILAGLSLTDAGSASDAVSGVLAGLGVSDSGTGSDAVAQILQSILVALADSGLGADGITRLLVNAHIEDAGSASDAVTGILAGLSLSDAGSGIDEILVLAGVLKAVADSGAGVDALTGITVSTVVGDSGSGSDALTVGVSLSLADAGVAADVVSTIQQMLKSLADSGVGTDAIGQVAASITLSDAGSATDAIKSISAILAVLDAGRAVDVAYRFSAGRITAVVARVMSPGMAITITVPVITARVIGPDNITTH